MKPANYTYDVFISHAVEDKIPLANELAARLEQEGLKVWYSSEALRVGSSITQTVHDGLDNSRYGIVILSKTYLSKNWTLREFFELLARHREGTKVILPVLLDVTPKDLAEKDLTMADLFAVRADRGIDHVVKTLLKEIRQETVPPTKQKNVWKNTLWWTFPAALITLAAVIALIVSLKKPAATPDQTELTLLVEEHIRQTQQKVDTYLAELRSRPSARAALPEEVLRKWTIFKDTKSYYRNSYAFSNFNSTVQSRKNVNAALQLDVEDLSPANTYTFTNPLIFMLEDESNSQPRVNYAFVNTQPVAYTIEPTPVDSMGTPRIRVRYSQNIRLAEAELIFPTASMDTKRHTLNIKGLRPTEQYQITRVKGSWLLKYIE
jgi:hypothetical protein